MMPAFFFEASPKGSSPVLAGLLLVTFITQPFIIEEKNRLATLHAMLPLTRGDIVKARYLYFVCIQAAITLPPLLVKPLVFPNNEINNFFIAGTFLTASFTTAVFYPLCFKVGYGKAYAIIVLPVLIFFIALFVPGALPGFLALCAQIIPATSPGKAAAGLLLLCLSYLLSLRIYRTRDL